LASTEKPFEKRRSAVIWKAWNVEFPTGSTSEVLPIPDRPYDGPVYEDAKDPAATFPPIEPYVRRRVRRMF